MYKITREEKDFKSYIREQEEQAGRGGALPETDGDNRRQQQSRMTLLSHCLAPASQTTSPRLERAEQTSLRGNGCQ